MSSYIKAKTYCDYLAIKNILTKRQMLDYGRYLQYTLWFPFVTTLFYDKDNLYLVDSAWGYVFYSKNKWTIL